MANPMPNYVVDEVYLAFSWPLVQEILTVDSVQDTTSDFGKQNEGWNTEFGLSIFMLLWSSTILVFLFTIILKTRK